MQSRFDLLVAWNNNDNFKVFKAPSVTDFSDVKQDNSPFLCFVELLGILALNV